MMSALQRLIDRCNEMDLTEQTNWLGDPLLAASAKAELTRKDAAVEALRTFSNNYGAHLMNCANPFRRDCPCGFNQARRELSALEKGGKS